MISIHAPAKGATNDNEIMTDVLIISIHAPAKGATGVVAWIVNIAVFQSTLPRRERLQPCLCIRLSGHFNPRSREGSDADDGYMYNNTWFISIHAPAKGATTATYFKIDFNNISIHAPAKGATG